MLCETAVRLALVEALAPTAAIASDAGFPTLAGKRVLDSRQVALTDLDGGEETPVIGVFSAEAESIRRGEAAGVDDRAATVSIEVVVELAVKQNDNDGAFADARASNDAEAEMLLSAIVAQIRRTIETAPEGAIFRKVTKGSVIKFSSVPHVLPEIGVRMARRFVSIEVEVRDDCHNADGGLPEPLATLDAALPAGSYAKGQVAAIAAMFGPHTLPALEGVTVSMTGRDDAGGGVEFTEQEGT